MSGIYDICPVLETDGFILRLVAEADAADLLLCYADPEAQAVFDFENCTSDFCYTTIEEMTDCIRFWLREYAQRMYVRFAVVDKQTQKAIGTVEMFGDSSLLRDHNGGVLRIDLASPYETAAHLAELLRLADDKFYTFFDVEFIVTKGKPIAVARVNALKAAGYAPYDWNDPDRAHYYGKARG